MDIQPVKTHLGDIQGHLVNCGQGLLVEEYLGIPYCQPPTGKLRFKDPQPLIKLPKDPFPADTFGASCSQNLDTKFGNFPGSTMWNPINQTSEDCLYLNLWLPHNTSKNLPVMIWIYGGGFYTGCSSLPIYNGATLASSGQVVLVSFNYRTSVFGFLCTGDGKIKGNFGLKDQLLALQWVKQNISSFGGDPNNITVFGESAGSASVAYHLMSPYFQNGLFHKAVFQSGGPNCRWAFMSKKQARERCEVFLKAVGYKENNNNDVLEYLQGLDTSVLLSNDWPKNTELAIAPFVPTLDNDFLLDHPQALLRNGQINGIDCIFGCNLDEGSLTGIYCLDFPNNDSPYTFSYEDFKVYEEKYDWDLSQDTRAKVTTFYTNHFIPDCSDSEANRQALIALSADRDFILPMLELGQSLCRAGADTYLYYLTHRASSEVWPRWAGVVHGADIQWIFGLPIQSPESYTDQERQFSKTIISWFTQFAKTGNPNGSGTGSEWPKYNVSQDYLEFKGPAQFVIHSKLKHEHSVFWDKIQE